MGCEWQKKKKKKELVSQWLDSTPLSACVKNVHPQITFFFPQMYIVSSVTAGV